MVNIQEEGGQEKKVKEAAEIVQLSGQDKVASPTHRPQQESGLSMNFQSYHDVPLSGLDKLESKA